MKRLIFLLLIGLMGVAPVLAQEPNPLTTEELEMIDFVLASYENMFEQTSYTSTIQQSTAYTVTAGFTTIRQELKQSGSSEIVLDPDGNASDMAIKMEQRIMSDAGDGQVQEANTQVEVIVYDGQMFMRFEDISQLPGIPEGWFNVADIAAMQMLNVEEYTKLTGANALQVYPINAETVAAIEELEPETIDGQEMRVFRLTWDTEALAGNAEVAAMLDAETFSQVLGIDPVEYMRQFMLGSTYEQIIWIGVDDNLPHRFDTQMITDATIEARMGNLELAQEMTTSATFGEFNTAIKIEAPTIGE